MPKDPTSIQSETSRKNSRKSRGGKRTKSSNGRRRTPAQAVCAETVALMHESLEFGDDPPSGFRIISHKALRLFIL